MINIRYNTCHDKIKLMIERYGFAYVGTILGTKHSKGNSNNVCVCKRKKERKKEREREREREHIVAITCCFGTLNHCTRAMDGPSILQSISFTVILSCYWYQLRNEMGRQKRRLLTKKID